ncbi:MAG: exodeoxyribonuclease VII small subunit [Proteobacteria bacterium]|nr:exodeoxyribonuclease VII small subunit [Pseudomonadota bacterium]MBU1595976.1 exodeoxyribonuclease VII small subunit [Pseudomonadota bacterium]
MAKDKQSFEKRLERLRGIVEALERGDLPLEQGLALYKEGLGLAGDCGRQLESAKNEVKLVQDGLLKEFAALDAAGDAPADPEGIGGEGA